MTTDRTLPPPQGPEYARCFGCGHIEPEHRPGTGPCLLCACVAYRSVPAIPEPPAAGLGGSATPSHTDQAVARLARIREWVTSDVVTARTSFGDGYREAQRDIRDLLDGRRLADETPEAEPSVHGESVAHLAGLHDNEPTVEVRQDGACPPGCIACATDESHDPTWARQDGAPS